MIRIIAGFLKNRIVRTDDIIGKKTRPSLAIVRKSIFDLIGDVSGKSCIDLFAGSGALGIEAISRGAKQVFFIEKDKSAFIQLRKNIDDMEVNSVGSVFNTDYRMALKAVKTRGQKFDIIFVDPPYRLTKEFTILEYVKMNDALSESGIIVHLSEAEAELDLNGYEVFKVKTFSKTKITILKGA